MDKDMVSADFYLVCRKPKPYKRMLARLTVSTPSLAADEIAIKLSVSLPMALFQRPALRASVTIPADSVPGPVIDSKVMDNIREVMAKQLGAEVTLTVIEPTKEQQPLEDFRI